MAKLTSEGAVIARCPGCDGSTSTFEWEYQPSGHYMGRQRLNSSSFGRVVKRLQPPVPSPTFKELVYLLLRCGGCGQGGIAAVLMSSCFEAASYPEGAERLLWFHPEVSERLRLPDAVPDGIKNEFREAESCLDANCYRAAGGLFRSVLDKTMRANGYKTNSTKDLYKQIEAAASDGVITESRRKRAHDEIRTLGNDILHDDWMPVSEDDVELAHHYTQRILEDFYDDRPSTQALLVTKGRLNPDGSPVTPPR